MESRRCNTGRILLNALLLLSFGLVFFNALSQDGVDSLIRKADSFYLPEEADSALSYLDKACAILEKTGDRSEYISCIEKRAQIFDRSGRYNEAREVYMEMLRKTEQWFGKKHERHTTALIRSGTVNRNLGNYEIALSYLLEALKIREDHYSHTDSLFAVILHEIGYTLNEQGNYQEAFEYFYEALGLRQNLFGDVHPDVAQTKARIGKTYYNTGNYDEALLYSKRALHIREHILPSDHFDLSRSYLDIGVIYGDIGSYIQSIDYLKKALDIRIPHLGEMHPDIAHVYNNLANNFHRIGRAEESIAYHQKAIEIRKQLLGEDHVQVAISFNNLADVFRVQRDYELAVHYFKRALAIAYSVFGEDHPFIGAFLNNLGLTYEQMEAYDQALEHYKKAVDVSLRTLDEVHPNIAIFYNNIGNVYRRQHDYRQSLEYHRRVLAIRYELLHPGHPDIAQSYYNFGINYQHLREYEKALEYLNRSLRIRAGTLGLHNQVTAATYYDIGLVYRDMGDYTTSLEYHQYAIQCLAPEFTDSSIFVNPKLEGLLNEAHLVEILTSKGAMLNRLFIKERDLEYLEFSFETVMLASDLVDKIRRGYGSDTSKLLLASRSHALYEYAIGIALSLKKLTDDPTYIREAFTFAEKARASVLWESVMDAHALSFAGIPDSLIQRERELRSDLAYYELQLNKAEDNDPFVDGYRRNFLKLRSDYSSLMETISSAHPEFYDLRYSISAFDPEDIFPLIEDNTAFVQFFLGEKSGYVFVITPGNISAYPTGSVSDIREAAQRLNTSLRRFDNRGYINYAHSLYTYLIEPIFADIDAKDKLIVIPDGILHYVPFEALLTSPADETGGRLLFSELDYLINQFEISYHYSARLYSHSAKRSGLGEKQFTFAGFAPVDFETEDDGFLLVTGTGDEPHTGAFDENIRIAVLDGMLFESLPFSKTEVEYIMSLFRSQNFVSEGFIHQYATADNFKRHASDYSILHIASHAFIDETNPHLSGIVFAYEEFDDRSGLGILHPGEIYTLNLNADLVVLSSCESGIGEFYRGEGIMAMTRGLMFAGASNIVVSLWKVYDRQTKELMVDFYSYLLQGNTYSTSLRNAKLRMLSEESTAFPQFWSGFILLGE